MRSSRLLFFSRRILHIQDSSDKQRAIAQENDSNMKSALSRMKLVLATLLVSQLALSAQAEVTSLRVARQYGIGYLQIMVMEHEKLVEKHARAQGLGDVAVTWNIYADGAVANDGIISGDLDFVAGGLGSFVILWDRTRGSLVVKGVAALDSMPMLLNTRNPSVKTIKDLTDQDRIAMAGVKVS